jgi:peptide/nickel transport system substrate-binding protein
MFKNRGPGIDPASLDAAAPVPALASGWEFSNDGLTITFRMRQGVKFHPVAPVNGRVMDIDDWRTSHNRWFATSEYRSQITSVVEKAEFPDARTMVWKLPAPFAGIYELIYGNQWAYPIVPKELNAEPRLAEASPIGTGYKVLDKHQPSVTQEYRKHTDYWGGDPFIERWHIPIVPEYSNRYAQFVQGSITDITPTARDVLLLRNDAPKTVIVAAPIPDRRTDWRFFGALSPQGQPWADPRVRVAIRRSIDFKSIGELLSNRKQLESAGIPIELTPMTHVCQDPGFWLNPEKGEMGPLSANFLYDPAEAKKLTAAAGHSGAIELPVVAVTVQSTIAEADQLVLDSLGRAGTFRVKTLQVPDAEGREYRTRLNFDGLTQQTGHEAEVDRIVFRPYHTDGNVPRSVQPYPDPRIDALILAQRKELDVQKRYGILKDIQLLLAELMPTIPGLHLYTTMSFRWPWLHNLAFGNPGSPPEGRPVGGGHLQWLDKDMPNRDKVA